MKIAVVSGGFDPIHSGHIDYIFEAKENADYLIVALNSDHWLSKKKGKPFMEFSERKQILESIKYVYEVVPTKWKISEATLKKYNIKLNKLQLTIIY